MNFDELPRWLLACEGLRLKPYLDTKKKWTIGIGRNISDRTLSKTEAQFLIAHDPVSARFTYLPKDWYLKTNEIVKYLNARPLNVSEAEYLLNIDILSVREELSAYEWYRLQPESVQCALVNMGFQMGVPRLTEFKEMIKYLDEKNYTQAAIEALNSQWGREFQKRAKDVALIIEKGHA